MESWLGEHPAPSTLRAPCSESNIGFLTFQRFYSDIAGSVEGFQLHFDTFMYVGINSRYKSAFPDDTAQKCRQEPTKRSEHGVR